MDTPIKKTNSPNITLTNKSCCTILKFELNCPVNRMYTLISVCSCSCYQYLLWVSPSFTKVKIMNHQHVVEPCGTLLNSLEKTHLYDNCPFPFNSYSGRGTRGFPLPSLSSSPSFLNPPSLTKSLFEELHVFDFSA